MKPVLRSAFTAVPSEGRWLLWLLLHLLKYRGCNLKFLKNLKSCYNNEIMLNIKVIIVTPATPPEIFYLPYLDSLFASQIKVLLIVVNLSNSSILLILSGTFLPSLGFYQYWLMLTRRQFLPDKIFGYVCPVGGRQDQHEATADVDQTRQLHPREGCTGGAVIGWNIFLSFEEFLLFLISYQQTPALTRQVQMWWSSRKW